MDPQSPKALMDQIDQLEHQVASLTTYCEKLTLENRSLRVSQETLNSEKASLLERNEQAKSRIESMIRRLKSMEQTL